MKTNCSLGCDNTLQIYNWLVYVIGVCKQENWGNLMGKLIVKNLIPHLVNFKYIARGPCEILWMKTGLYSICNKVGKMKTCSVACLYN